MDKVKKILEKVKEFLKICKEKCLKIKDNLLDKSNADGKGNISSYIKKAIDFIVLHKRYFLAGVLFVVFSVVLITGAGKGSSIFGDHSAGGNAGKFEKNMHADVNELIEQYYEAYAEGDCEKLIQTIEPLSDNEAEYIRLFSSFIESISVKNVYTQQGVEEGSYLVSVEMAIKFVNVETEAPGMEFFYVETGRDDKLYINNLYSQFNMQVSEYVKDETVMAAIYAYEDREELKEVQLGVEEDYRNAISADEALAELISTTIAREISAWMASIEIVINQMPPEGTLSADAAEPEADEDANEPEQDTEQEQEPEQEPEEEEEAKQEILDVDVTEKVVTLIATNVRKKATKDSDIITTVEGGTELEVVAIDDWGLWTCVKIGDSVGYIRNDLIETVETEHAVAGKPAYPSLGQAVILIKNQNAYVNMDDTSTVIANLKLGTTLTVEMCYANGWSKVSWDDGAMIGYVPTATLKLD